MKCIILVAYLLGAGLLAAKEIGIGDRFKSPDGRWVAECSGGGVLSEVNAINILDAVDGHTNERIELRPPLYFVGWTRDSRTLAIVQHIAGGTVADVFHLEGREWKGRSVEPGDGNKFQVIRLKLMEHTIELTYKGLIMPSEQAPAQFFVMSFTFDPSSAAHSSQHKTSIDATEYARLDFE